jgi:lysozyme family protein
MKFFEWLSGLLKQFFSFFEGVKAPATKPTKPIDLPKPGPSEGKVIIAPKTPEDYTIKFNQAKVLPQHLGSAKAIANKIIAAKDMYSRVENYTGVPWYIIAAIHSLESGLNFKSVLHNGEQIVGTGKKTTLVPAGKGPFATWDEAAIDALGGHGAHFNKKDWKIGQWLDFLCRYNGMGYTRRGLDSPYLWSFTSEQRTTGRYIADGVFDPKAVSKQCGCVAIIKTLMS